MEFLCENDKQVLVVNYFLIEAPPQIIDWVLNTPLFIVVILDEEESRHEGNANEERIHFPDGIKPAVVKLTDIGTAGNNHSELSLPYYDDHRESSDSYDDSFDPFRSFLGDDVFNFNKEEEEESVETVALLTAQKIKFFVKDFFSKYDQIRREMQIWSHLLKKSYGKLNFLKHCLTHFMKLFSFYALIF